MAQSCHGPSPLREKIDLLGINQLGNLAELIKRSENLPTLLLYLAGMADFVPYGSSPDFSRNAFAFCTGE